MEVVLKADTYITYRYDNEEEFKKHQSEMKDYKIISTGFNYKFQPIVSYSNK